PFNLKRVVVAPGTVGDGGVGCKPTIGPALVSARNKQTIFKWCQRNGDWTGRRGGNSGQPGSGAKDIGGGSENPTANVNATRISRCAMRCRIKDCGCIVWMIGDKYTARIV